MTARPFRRWRRIFEETFPVCREMTYARCRHVHFYQRILRALLQVFSPLL